jgi:Leu/Phe-tRNA-protein transferase
MNIMNNLPNEIQELIYNQYLEKQRDYYINQYKNRIKLLYIEELEDNIDCIDTAIVESCIDSYSDSEWIDTNINEIEEDLYENTYEYFIDYYFRNNLYLYKTRL